MSKELICCLAAVIAILVICRFAILYSYAYWRSRFHPDSLHEFPTLQYVYVVKALSGLVGGVVAMVFNHKLPDKRSHSGMVRSASAANAKASGLRVGLSALQTSATLKAGLLEIVSVAYVLIYFAAAIAAIVTWIIVKDNTPDLLKNLALISIGLFVAILHAPFSTSQAEIDCPSLAKLR